MVALLAAAGPDGLSTDRLADELYGDELTSGWEASVRQHVRRLRKTIGVQEIATRNGRYILNVPTDQVDLWLLLDADDLDLHSVPQALVHELLSGEPFTNIEPSPLLQQSHEPIASARLRLLQRMTEHAVVDWSAKTLLSTRTLATRSNYQEDVLAAVLELHLACGQVAAASELGAKAQQFLFHEMHVGLSAHLQALLDRIEVLAQNPTSRPDEPIGEVVTGRVVGMYEPAVSSWMIERPRLRAAIVHGLTCEGVGVLISGDSGSGKSALAQSVVPALAAAGQHVLWLSGRRGSSGAYQPFLTALPSLEADLAPLIDGGGNELLRMQCWGAVRRRLTTEFGDLPLVLVVDDAQWLDTHSQALVVFLASTQDDAAPRLLAIGRDDPAAHDWAHFSNEITRLGLTIVEVDAFDHDELLELIGLYHQTSTSMQRYDFASTLLHQRASLPAVAHELIRSADPDTLSVTKGRADRATASLWVDKVDEIAQLVAATAAAVGMRFRLDAIADLTDFDLDTIVEASETLLRAGVWVPEQRLDEFSFRHVLIHAEFDSVLDKVDRRRLHLRLGEEADARGDVHASASHFVQAGALAGNDRVVQTLLTSAREFHRRGSYREAVDAFFLANRFAGEQLDIDDLLDFSSAVSSSGGDGWGLRLAAFERALEQDDAERCLDAALHGALTTEDSMGQTRRVDMLERVDADQLGDQRRAEHAAALARELGLLGLHDRAVETSTRAMAQVSEPEDRFTAWLGSWASCRALPPDKWPPLPADRGKVSRPELVSRLAQVEFGLALVTGDDAEARQRFHEFASHPAIADDPLRSWHRGLAETTLHFVDGGWDDSRRVADETFRAASEQGVVAAFGARLAQEFVLQWIVGQHAALLAQFGSAAPDVHDTVLAQAAYAVILAEYEEHHQQAAALIGEVATRAIEHRSPLSPSTAALLATAPSALRSAETNQTLRATLEPFLGSALVTGAVLSHLGPASWSLARLATSPDEQIDLLHQACNEADRWNLRLWSVVCQRDLAALTKDQKLRAAARDLAAGTQLEILL